MGASLRAGRGLCPLRAPPVLIAHIAIAMGARHGWSHAAAWSATAQQTASVYGLAWGGGVYFNYAFARRLAAGVVAWQRSPERQARRPGVATWAIRLFFVVIIFNAAVVFAGGWRRAIGAVIVFVLIASWTTRKAAGSLS